LKIGLNATCLNDRPSGAKHRFVGIYGELVKRLPDAKFVIYEPADCRVGAWFDGAPNVEVRSTPIPSEGRAQKLVSGLRYWHTALALEGFDIFEGLNLPLVKAPTGRTLLTVHDIRGVRSEAGVMERAAYRLFLERSLRAADHVITVSEAMKQEILSFAPETSISVIYNGLDATRYINVTEADQQTFRSNYGLPEKFILAVGHLERRKNYLRLIDAMARLRDGGLSCSLLIVGNDNGEKKVIEERIESAKLSGTVKFLSGLSDLEVRCAYKLCSLFVFPSSYEGFGIPILEAMAAERPMVLSDTPVFREITQDMGVFFPHADDKAMALAIESVLSSGSEYTRLVDYGKERVQAFSFGNLSLQLENLYRNLVPHAIDR
jgi:glycosyltransferase involved in cell wall biosynthesis